MVTRSASVFAAGAGALAAACLAAALVGPGCARKAPPERVIVRGAPSVGAIVAELGRGFRTIAPDVDVVPDCVCPPCVVIQDGVETKPYDVWVAWGEWELEQLEKRGGLAFGERAEVGFTRLAIAARRDLAGELHGVSDLQSDAVKAIGVGDPDLVSSGHYAKLALEKAGLWSELEGRFQYSRSGCELLKWLALERRVDAAIVFEACIQHENVSVDVVQELPEDLAPPVPLVFALPSQSADSDAARRFLEYVRSPAASEILRANGLTPVVEP